MPDNLKEIVQSILIDCAKNGELITYSGLIAKIRSIIPTDLGPHDPRLFHILGEISIEEDRSNRGMLSAVVIREADRQPGPGFFKLANDLDKNTSNKEDFWIGEVQKVFGQWRRI
jgi:hypothetical protein